MTKKELVNKRFKAPTAPRVFRSVEAWQAYYFPHGLPEVPEQVLLAPLSELSVK